MRKDIFCDRFCLPFLRGNLYQARHKAIGDISGGTVSCGQNTDIPNCSAVQCKGYRSVALDSVNSVFGSKTDKNTEEMVRSLFVDGQGDAAIMNKPDAVVAFERVQAQLKARLGSEVHSSDRKSVV